MLTVKELSAFLNTVAPYDTQCGWDNSGLLCGDPAKEVRCAAFALDLTSETLSMAKDAGADVLVTHHPVIFQPKRRLLSDDPVWALCRSGLAAVSVHTPWDCAEGGVSDVLCGLLGLEHGRLQKGLPPRSAQPYSSCPAGIRSARSRSAAARAWTSSLTQSPPARTPT